MTMTVLKDKQGNQCVENNQWSNRSVLKQTSQPKDTSRSKSEEKLVALAHCHIEKIPFIKHGGRRLAVWTDIKEILFPSCSEKDCNIVLNALKIVCRYPWFEDKMQPCTPKLYVTFLRQFRVVPPGTLLVSLPVVKDSIMDLWSMVRAKHLTSKEDKSQLCLYSKPGMATHHREHSNKQTIYEDDTKHNECDKVDGVNNQCDKRTAKSCNDACLTCFKFLKVKNVEKNKDGQETIGTIPAIREENATCVNKYMPIRLLCDCMPHLSSTMMDICGDFLVKFSKVKRPVLTRTCSAPEGRELTRWLYRTKGWDDDWQHLTSRDILICWNRFLTQIQNNSELAGKCDATSLQSCETEEDCQDNVPVDISIAIRKSKNTKQAEPLTASSMDLDTKKEKEDAVKPESSISTTPQCRLENSNTVTTLCCRTSSATPVLSSPARTNSLHVLTQSASIIVNKDGSVLPVECANKHADTSRENLIYLVPVNRSIQTKSIQNPGILQPCGTNQQGITVTSQCNPPKVSPPANQPKKRLRVISPLNNVGDYQERNNSALDRDTPPGTAVVNKMEKSLTPSLINKSKTSNIATHSKPEGLQARLTFLESAKQDFNFSYPSYWPVAHHGRFANQQTIRYPPPHYLLNGPNFRFQSPVSMPVKSQSIHNNSGRNLRTPLIQSRSSHLNESYQLKSKHSYSPQRYVPSFAPENKQNTNVCTNQEVKSLTKKNIFDAVKTGYGNLTSGFKGDTNTAKSTKCESGVIGKYDIVGNILKNAKKNDDHFQELAQKKTFRPKPIMESLPSNRIPSSVLLAKDNWEKQNLIFKKSNEFNGKQTFKEGKEKYHLSNSLMAMVSANPFNQSIESLKAVRNALASKSCGDSIHRAKQDNKKTTKQGRTPEVGVSKKETSVKEIKSKCTLGECKIFKSKHDKSETMKGKEKNKKSTETNTESSSKQKQKNVSHRSEMIRTKYDFRSDSEDQKSNGNNKDNLKTVRSKNKGKTDVSKTMANLCKGTSSRSCFETPSKSKSLDAFKIESIKDQPKVAVKSASDSVLQWKVRCRDLKLTFFKSVDSREREEGPGNVNDLTNNVKKGSRLTLTEQKRGRKLEKIEEMKSDQISKSDDPGSSVGNVLLALRRKPEKDKTSNLADYESVHVDGYEPIDDRNHKQRNRVRKDIKSKTSKSINAESKHTKKKTNNLQLQVELEKEARVRSENNGRDMEGETNISSKKLNSKTCAKNIDEKHFVDKTTESISAEIKGDVISNEGDLECGKQNVIVDTKKRRGHPKKRWIKDFFKNPAEAKNTGTRARQQQQEHTHEKGSLTKQRLDDNEVFSMTSHDDENSQLISVTFCPKQNTSDIAQTVKAKSPQRICKAKKREKRTTDNKSPLMGSCTYAATTEQAQDAESERLVEGDVYTVQEILGGDEIIVDHEEEVFDFSSDHNFTEGNSNEGLYYDILTEPPILTVEQTIQCLNENILNPSVSPPYLDVENDDDIYVEEGYDSAVSRATKTNKENVNNSTLRNEVQENCSSMSNEGGIMKENSEFNEDMTQDMCNMTMSTDNGKNSSTTRSKMVKFEEKKITDDNEPIKRRSPRKMKSVNYGETSDVEAGRSDIDTSLSRKPKKQAKKKSKGKRKCTKNKINSLPKTSDEKKGEEIIGVISKDSKIERRKHFQNVIQEQQLMYDIIQKKKTNRTPKPKEPKSDVKYSLEDELTSKIKNGYEESSYLEEYLLQEESRLEVTDSSADNDVIIKDSDDVNDFVTNVVIKNTQNTKSSRNTSENAGTNRQLTDEQINQMNKTEQKKREALVPKEYSFLPEITKGHLVTSDVYSNYVSRTEPPGVKLSSPPLSPSLATCINNGSLCYTPTFGKDGLEIGGLICHTLFVIPYVLLNGYKFVTVLDAARMFTECSSKCGIAKQVLQRSKVLFKTFCTWEQVYTLDLIYMKRGRTIKTGDALIKLDSLLSNYSSVLEVVKEKHKAPRFKNIIPSCRYNLE